jgi:hypothetical protein
MPERNPILITGAAGEIGGVSRTMVDRQQACNILSDIGVPAKDHKDLDR